MRFPGYRRRGVTLERRCVTRRPQAKPLGARDAMFNLVLRVHHDVSDLWKLAAQNLFKLAGDLVGVRQGCGRNAIPTIRGPPADGRGRRVAVSRPMTEPQPRR